MAFTIVTEIPGSQCIGDSRATINNNFSALEERYFSLSSAPVLYGTTDTIALSLSAENSQIRGNIVTGSITNPLLAANSVNTLQLTANSVTYAKLATTTTTPSTETVANRIAHAWVQFNGTAVTTTTAFTGLNVSDVIKNSTGSYTINFTTPLNTAVYATVATPSTSGTVVYTGTKTINDTQIFSTNLTGGPQDAFISAIIIGI